MDKQGTVCGLPVYYCFVVNGVPEDQNRTREEIIEAMKRIEQQYAQANESARQRQNNIPLSQPKEENNDK